MSKQQKLLIKAFLIVILEKAIRDISVGASFVMLPIMMYVSKVYDTNYGMLCLIATIVFFLLALFSDRAAEEDEKKANELYAQWEKERGMKNEH